MGAIVSFVVGFVIAQLIKRLITGRREGWRQALRGLTKTGDCPSGHAAGVIALTTFLGLADGPTTSVFGLALAMSAIVVYDALHVRYAVGELGVAMQKVVKKIGLENAAPKIVKGHKIVEVIAGVLLGFVVGAAVYLLS